MNRIDLCGEWELSDETGHKHKGQVPGCVHTDLFTADEMYWEKNSLDCQYIEKQDWIYKRQFVVPSIYKDAELVFEGLDTYCDIYLNDTLIGSTDNMFIYHKFPVDEVLREGTNILEVHFRSPIREVEGKESLPGAFTTERLHSRRMQCTYGWDWMERFVTYGIYRPVYIVFHEAMEMEHVYVFTNSIDRYSAQIKVTENFRGYETGGLVKTEVLSPQGEVLHTNDTWVQEEESILYFDIDNPQLWYPHTYGEQPLYTLRITVGNQITYQKFGIRTVKILQVKDCDEQVIQKCKELQQTEGGQRWDQNEEYSGFILLINGVKIFCSGANWVPCEPFPSAETEEKITKNLEKGVEVGINMLRVWGGGLFEKQHFYDECDRLGILVTQDFLMACGKYPEQDEQFQKHLQKEAEFAALYLRNHPSLVWWTGDNENATEGDDSQDDYWGRVSARKVIAPILDRLDYNRRFLFSSPYGGKKYASRTVGTTHNTNYLGFLFQYMEQDDLSDYREYWQEYIARFIAEEPVMGAVCKRSLNEFVSKENQCNYDMWLFHTKNNPGLKRHLMDYINEFTVKLFGEYKNWDDRYFKMRYLQYEWLRFTFCNARSSLWFNSGIIYWMFNDCWPAAMGWSLVDYYLRPKAGYFAFQHYAKPVTAYIDKRDNKYNLHISHILEKEITCEYEVQVLNLLNNQKMCIKKDKMTLCAEAVSCMLDVCLERNEMLIVEVKVEDYVVRNWYREGAPHLQKTDALQYKITGTGVELWSEEYIHVVEIEGAEHISDNYFSLLPGERRMITLQSEDNKEVEVVGYTFDNN